MVTLYALYKFKQCGRLSLMWVQVVPDSAGLRVLVLANCLRHYHLGGITTVRTRVRGYTMLNTRDEFTVGAMLCH